MEPKNSKLEGFDVVSYSVNSSPECSPLSCNSLAESIPTNGHCLINSFEDAKCLIENGRFVNSEPPPWRIVAVYSI